MFSSYYGREASGGRKLCPYCGDVFRIEGTSYKKSLKTLLIVIPRTLSVAFFVFAFIKYMKRASSLLRRRMLQLSYHTEEYVSGGSAVGTRRLLSILCMIAQTHSLKALIAKLNDSDSYINAVSNQY